MRTTSTSGLSMSGLAEAIKEPGLADYVEAVQERANCAFASAVEIRHRLFGLAGLPGAPVDADSSTQEPINGRLLTLRHTVDDLFNTLEDIVRRL